MRLVQSLPLVALASCLGSQPRWHATPEQMAPLATIQTIPTTIGPLAVDARPTQTSWTDVGKARKLTEGHYLDKPRIHAETSEFLTFIDTFYAPLTDPTRVIVNQLHRDMPRLEELAPYSMWNVTLAFQQSSYGLDLCILNAGVMAWCGRDEQAPTPPSLVPFEVGEVAPGIGLLAVHDLRDATAPAWSGFAAARRKLAAARGLVIDLRDAAGSDPRALMPLLSDLTGLTELRPLRAIERPASADSYVAAYNSRFTDRGRDSALWATFVGSQPSHARRTDRPIAVLVGTGCQSACELAARVLATYAGATVFGGVTTTGRLARDEPAMFVLPHSQTSVYFHATRYLLAAEIEAATGPTEQWRALGADRYIDSTQLAAFAQRDVTERLAHRGSWPPPCSSLPTTATPKLRGDMYLATPEMCTDGFEITILAKVPQSALEEFVSTCSSHIDLNGVATGMFAIRTPPPRDVLAQIASSDLVDSVSVRCEQRAEPD